jgi:anaphase-promoting complex subunit 4
VLFGKVHEIGVTETTGPVAMRMSAVVSLQRFFSNLADMLRILLGVGLMLLLCQKTSQILVCKLLSIVESKLSVYLVQIIRLGLFIENGISQVQSVDTALVQLGDGRIKDVKFMDDKVLLVLWESSGTVSLKLVNLHRC